MTQNESNVKEIHNVDVLHYPIMHLTVHDSKFLIFIPDTESCLNHKPDYVQRRKEYRFYPAL